MGKSEKKVSFISGAVKRISGGRGGGKKRMSQEGLTSPSGSSDDVEKAEENGRKRMSQEVVTSPSGRSDDVKKAEEIGRKIRALEKEMRPIKAEIAKRTLNYDKACNSYKKLEDEIAKIEKDVGSRIVMLLRKVRAGKKGAEDRLEESIGDDIKLEEVCDVWSRLMDKLPELEAREIRAHENKKAADAKEPRLLKLEDRKNKLMKNLYSISVVNMKAWEMLNETFPMRVFEMKIPSSNSSLKPANFPANPSHVFTFSKKCFFDLCKGLKYVEDLKGLDVEKGLALKLHYVVLRQQSLTSGLEQQTQTCVESALSSLFGVCNMNGVTEKAGIYGKIEKMIGKMDFEIGRKEGADELTELVIAGEVKTIKVNKEELSTEYCDVGCKKKDCKSQRHRNVSPIRQLYNYMVLNGLFYGILTTYQMTWGFIRDCHGNLGIVPGISYDSSANDTSTSPFTISQFVVLFYMLATDHKENLPESVSNYAALIPCRDGNCKGHRRLPEDCRHPDNGAKDENISFYKPSSSSSSSSSSSQPKERLSVTELELGEVFEGGYRSDSTRRASLPNGVGGVLKLNDIFKTPEMEEEMIQEGKVYERLQELQGVVIPKLIGLGRFEEDFLFGLMTSEEGHHVRSTEHVNEEFIAKAEERLKMIHEKGVLHNDIRRPNILRNTNGDPVFIDFNMSTIVGERDQPQVQQQMHDELRQLRMILKDSEYHEQ